MLLFLNFIEFAFSLSINQSSPFYAGSVGEYISVKTYKEHNVWPSKRVLLKALFSFAHYSSVSLRKASVPVFATFIIRLPFPPHGNFSAGRFSARTAFFLCLKPRTNASHASCFFSAPEHINLPTRVGPSVFDGGEAAFSKLLVVRYAMRIEYKLSFGMNRCSANDR